MDVRLAQGRTTPRGLLGVGAGFLFPAWQLAIIRRQLCHPAGETLPRSAGAGGDSGSAPIAPGRRGRNRRRNASRPEHSATRRVLTSDTALLVKMEWATDERFIRHQLAVRSRDVCRLR